MPLGEVTKNHCGGHLKWEHFMILKMCLHKAVKKGKERKQLQKGKDVNGGNVAPSTE